MSRRRKVDRAAIEDGSIDISSAAMSAPRARFESPAITERAGTLDSGDADVHCALTLPQGYEPGYAYPLIVWFHDEGSDEQELARVMPHISERNYVGLSLRGPLPVVNGLPQSRRWSLSNWFLKLLEDELAASLPQTAEQVNVHWGRVIVAGMGQGASVALRLLLRRPEWFAGAACLGGEWSKHNRFEAWGCYANKSIWLGHVRGWSSNGADAAVSQARLLATAGFDVTTHVAEFDDAAPARLGSAVDRWLMQTLCPDTAVM